MKRIADAIFWGAIFLLHINLYGQDNENCFLNDFGPKTAQIPTSTNAVKPSNPATVTVTIQGDTLGKISKYIFGNAIAAWAGAHNNPVLVQNAQLLAPTLIRFPGGSWSNGYFWNGVPSDVPDSIYDGTTYNSTTKTATKNKFYGQTGSGGWQTTPNQWYALREAVGSQGLITINYGYARYGTGDDPVGQAAKLAADWVRYDDGRTKYWEIGNENSGPWEYGWMIDTALNKDGQPRIITGELYGKHFKVFADSMRNAAAEIGSEIYIGAIVIHFPPAEAWNEPDKKWNEGLFKEIGDTADFYVMHNYFSTSTNVKSILDLAVTEPKKNIDFIRKDIADKKAYLKPVAITEYNIGSGTTARANSYVTGMQAVVLFNEMIKNNFGLSARWLLVTGETGMFYDGSDANYKYHPHPEFYYCLYAPKFTGDHVISASSSNADVLCYASRYSSGETGVTVVNKGAAPQVVSIDTKTIGVGQKYYIYSFEGGTDNGDFSQNVNINGYSPSTNQWGPYDDLSSIPAYSYPIEDQIKFPSPARSVQMIMVEGGNNILTVNDKAGTKMPYSYNLYQNYPNPFNPNTTLSYSLPKESIVKLSVYDVMGREIAVVVDNETKFAGVHTVPFNAERLSSGVYFYKLQTNGYTETKRMLLLK